MNLTLPRTSVTIAPQAIVDRGRAICSSMVAIAVQAAFHQPGSSACRVSGTSVSRIVFLPSWPSGYRWSQTNPERRDRKRKAGFYCVKYRVSHTRSDFTSRLRVAHTDKV